MIITCEVIAPNESSDNYRLSASAFYGVSIVTPHPLCWARRKMLPLLERAPSLSKNHRFPCIALLTVLERVDV